MVGISSSALRRANYAENRFKYNRKELQNKEFGELEKGTIPANLMQQFSRLEKLSPAHKDHIIAVIDAFEAKEKLYSKIRGPCE